MATQNQVDFSKKYKHFNDIRPKKEIQITNNLVNALTEMNLSRVTSKQFGLNQQSNPSNNIRKSRKQNFLYVCFSGLPPFQNEFDSLGIPGEMITITPQLFQFQLNEEQREERIQYCTFEAQSKRVNELINEKSLTKQIILVYHSYGTYLVSTYLHFYGNKRVKGMIDIGGTPITIFPIVKAYIKMFQHQALEDIQKYVDDFYDQNKRLKEGLVQGHQNNFIVYQSKARTRGVIHVFKRGRGFYQLFQWNRSWPNVLKLMIFGKKDHYISENLFGEKVSFYCYKRQMDQEYKQSLIEKYTALYGKTVQNIQERFIFRINEGYHSLHMQKKYQDLIKNIINEYLQFIEHSENKSFKDS